MILLGLVAVFVFRNSEIDQKEEVVVRSIAPVYHNPTLVLADGTVVSLEPKKKKLFLKTV